MQIFFSTEFICARARYLAVLYKSAPLFLGEIDKSGAKHGYKKHYPGGEGLPMHPVLSPVSFWAESNCEAAPSEATVESRAHLI